MTSPYLMMSKRGRVIDGRDHFILGLYFVFVFCIFVGPSVIFIVDMYLIFNMCVCLLSM